MLSKDDSSIDYTFTDVVPTNLKKFRSSPEIEGFYRFVYENDLQRETFEILEHLRKDRYLKKTQKQKK